MLERAEANRLIVTNARPEAFVPLARVILSRMGYAILQDQEWRDAPAYAMRRPDLRIADAAQWGDVEDEALAGVPVVLLTGRQGVESADPRILGAIRKPAGLHELYRLIQQALEPNPRASVRIATELAARCRQEDREWKAEVLSLSENGCLLRTPEPLSLGTELDIAFELPSAGWIETRAESAYQLLPDTGLVFQQTSPASREAILAYVEQHLGS